MSFEQEKTVNDFFTGYRGRYSTFWIERFGLIPELPTSFDNANSIYELLAWLQRAFKVLLDDFVTLESEMESFKEAISELLENLVPLLIRRYMGSKEFDDKITKKLSDFLENTIKPLLYKELANRDEKIKELERELQALKQEFNEYKQSQGQKNQQLENALNKIIENLESSGAWSGGLNGQFNQGRNLATGNINLFGGTPDGGSFIRTNNGQTENDLAGGI